MAAVPGGNDTTADQQSPDKENPVAVPRITGSRIDLALLGRRCGGVHRRTVSPDPAVEGVRTLGAAVCGRILARAEDTSRIGIRIGVALG